ncbi:MAG: helix-turn-helix domain-containing protein [Parcubacteria group bacterium]|jgi:predicted transcriptional regulator
MQKIAIHLKEAGFEEKEAEIYLAVLELGKATVSDISRKAGIKRTTIYEYLEKLLNESLIHKTVKGKRVYYAAENPDKLVNILEKRKRKISSILPQLQGIFDVSRHIPQVRFYEGIEGMRTIYDEMTKTSQTIYGVFSADKYFSVFNKDDNERFFQNIREHGGQIKDVIENSPVGKKHAKSKYYEGIGTPKILPKDFRLSVDLMVAGNKVAMLSLVNLAGVIIENSEIADLQRNFIKFMRRNI